MTGAVPKDAVDTDAPTHTVPVVRIMGGDEAGLLKGVGRLARELRSFRNGTPPWCCVPKCPALFARISCLVG